jgi:hypothetical protein
MPVKISNSKYQISKIGIKNKNFKFWIAILIFEFWILNLNCYAAPCYGTKLPEKRQFFIGVQTHSIFKRYLENNSGKLRSQQEFFLLSWGVFDWLSIDLKGGAGLIKQHPAGSDGRDYSTFMGGGYGFRIKLYDKKNIKSVFGFQHISIHPHTIQIQGTKHKAVLDDWQFSALLSRDFKKLIPYLGARWSRLDYIHWTNGNRNRIKSDLNKSAGFIFGTDLALTERTWLNLEGSYFDSGAFAFSINYGF